MEKFNFYYPIQVRYSDLDPQGHVNNARAISFIESARIAYIQHLNLWDGKSFIDFELIVANVNMNYTAPILMNQSIRIGVKVTRLGGKSLEFEYLVEDPTSGQVKMRGTTTMVTYSYHTLSTIHISEVWRKTIADFEGIAQYPER